MYSYGVHYSLQGGLRTLVYLIFMCHNLSLGCVATGSFFSFHFLLLMLHLLYDLYLPHSPLHPAIPGYMLEFFKKSYNIYMCLCIKKQFRCDCYIMFMCVNINWHMTTCFQWYHNLCLLSVISAAGERLLPSPCGTTQSLMLNYISIPHDHMIILRVSLPLIWVRDISLNFISDAQYLLCPQTE